MYTTNGRALRPDLTSHNLTEAELARTAHLRENLRRQDSLLQGIAEDVAKGNVHGVIIGAGLLHAVRSRYTETLARQALASQAA